MKLNVLANVSRRFERHRSEWETCTKCEIGKIAHEHVFCRGTLPCDVLFIGEAPGKTEDLTGEPFVGKSGDILDGWIDRMQLLRPDLKWAITNTVCCRPTDRLGGSNRAPGLQEMANCRPRLIEFFDIARPRALVLLGRIAQGLDLTGPRTLGLPVARLYHPAFIGYNGGKGSKVDLETGDKLVEFARRLR